MDLVRQEIRRIKQDQFAYLEHPGKIHFIYKKKDEEVVSSGSGGYGVVRQSSSVFSQHLLLLERMVLDHLEMYYREALEKAADT